MKKIDEHFNEEAKLHDENFVKRLGLSEYYDEVERILKTINPKKKVLVLGCGTGLEIERFHFSCEVLGIDLSEEMVKSAQSKTYDSNVSLETYCGSFLDYEFGNDIYDVVLSSYTMHHFNEEQKVKLYTNIYNTLHKGGVFILGDSMSQTLEIEKQKINIATKIYNKKNLPFGSLHIDVHFYLEHELEVLNKAGFNIISLEKEWTNTKILKAVK